MQQHKLPACLCWAVQAGRTYAQYRLWMHMARDYKLESRSYTHCVDYARAAHKEYRRLIELSLQHRADEIVDNAMQSMESLHRFSKARNGSPILPR